MAKKTVDEHKVSAKKKASATSRKKQTGMTASEAREARLKISQAKFAATQERQAKLDAERAERQAKREAEKRKRQEEQERKRREEREARLMIAQAKFDAQQQREAERKARQEKLNQEREAERKAREQRQAQRDNLGQQKLERQMQVQNLQSKTNTARSIIAFGKSVTPEPSGSLPRISKNVSWGMLFLVVLVIFWLSLNKAPQHNESRFMVIWNTILGKEEIA